MFKNKYIYSLKIMIFISISFFPTFTKADVVGLWHFDGNMTDVLSNNPVRNNKLSKFVVDHQVGTQSLSINISGQNGIQRIPLLDSAQLNGTKKFGISFWVKISNNAGNYHAIFGSGKHNLCIKRAKDKEGTHYVISGGNLGDWGKWWHYKLTIPFKTWTQIALTADGKHARLYVNGNLIKKIKQTGSLSFGNSIFLGGSSKWADPQSALFDELVLYKGKPGQNWAYSVYKQGKSGDNIIIKDTNNKNLASSNKKEYYDKAPIKEKYDVVAGNTINIRINTSGISPGSMVIRLGGWVQSWPSIWHIYKAAEYASQKSIVQNTNTHDNFPTVHPRGTGYETILHIKNWPKTNKPLKIWYLAKGANMCLRSGKNKELRWNWQRPSSYKWMSFGTYTKEQVQGGMYIMTHPSKQPDKTGLKAVVITNADNMPSLGKKIPYRGQFSWRTTPASVGKHHFEWSISRNGKKLREGVINVTVKNPKGNNSNSSKKSSSGVKVNPINLNNISAKIRLTGKNSIGFFSQKKAINEINIKSKLSRVLPKVLTTRLGDAAGIALQSSRTTRSKEYPKTIKVKVNNRADAIIFYHGELGNRSDGQVVFRYEIHFKNGDALNVPVKEGVQIAGIQKSKDISGAELIYEGFNGIYTTKIYKYIFVLPKKLQDKTIGFINATSGNYSTIPIIFGIALIDGDIKSNNIVENAAKLNDTYVSIDYKHKLNTISRDLFSTNDQTANSRYAPSGDRKYEKIMQQIDPSLLRVHLGRSMSRIFPNPDSKGNLHIIDGIGRVFNNPHRRGEHVMICFGSIPKWVDITNKKLREHYAEDCEKVAAYLLNTLHVSVTYWEPFNEPGHILKTNRDDVWKLYKAIAKRIHKLNSSAKVGGPTLAWPSMGIIRSFLEKCNKQIDFISWHCYPTGSVKTPTSLLMSKTDIFGNQSRKIQKLIAKYIPGRRIETALTEYNINYGWKPTDPRQATYIGACWMASVLVNLADAGQDIAQTWHSKGGGTFGMISSSNIIHPAAWLMKILNHNFAGKQRVAAKSNDKNVQILAVASDKHASFMLVNKSSLTKLVTIESLNGAWPDSIPMAHPITAWIISKQSSPVAIKKLAVKLNRAGDWEIQMPAYSVKIFSYELR